jgi:PAS domain S-box-containing protein
VFRKIIWQLLFSYLLVILFSLGMTGFFLLRSLESHFISNAESTLTSSAQVISKLWESSLREKTLSMREKRMVHLVTERLAWQSGSRVRIINERQEILMDTGDRPGDPPENKTQIEKAFLGVGSMEILEPEGKRASMLSIAYPVTIIRGSPGVEKVVGIVYITRSLVYTKEIIESMKKEYGVGIVLSLITLGLLSLVLSAYISGPIRDMTIAADRIAEGNLSYPIPVGRVDEIGILARRFDYMRQRLSITMGELLEEKKKLSAVLSHMADGVMVFDSAREIIMINSAAMALLGSSDLKSLVEHFNALDVPPFQELRKLVNEVLTTGSEGEKMVRSFAGERVAEVAYSLLKGEKGNAMGLVLLLHDITELQRLDEMKTEFVTNVSHELRTPLASIKGFAELLLDGACDDRERSQSFLVSINREVDRLTRLVRSLLDLSKMESGLIKMEIQAVNLPALVDSVVNKLSPQAQAHEVTLSTEFPARPMVRANADRVEQVLVNFLGNALRFAPSGSSIDIVVEQDTARAQVKVIDRGPGLGLEDQKRVFDRFYRVDKARSRDHGGSGLGLAIARQIIESLGGKIGVESTPGKGCTFFFTLPLDRESGENELPDCEEEGIKE